ncbi:MAG: hypothetical protein EOP11_00555 [Proteobacteria bacterium]|nr:MAG: hypothetical protein EOP11_00555 [Pseudomonadota bacterium]
MIFKNDSTLSLIAIALIAIASPAEARKGHAPASASEPMDPAFEVSVNPDVYPVAAFEKHGFKTDALEKNPASSYDAPAPEARDQIFARISGLEAVVAPMDMLDKDLLFIRARNYSNEKLRVAYPKVDPRILTELAEALRAR